MKRILIILCCIWAMLTSTAQVSFTLDAPKSATTNSQIRISYTLSNARLEKFNEPSFKDFEVLAGPSQSTYSSTQIINGHSTSRSGTTITYILTPRKAGTLAIPAATVKANGQTYTTNAAKIAVKEGSDANNSSGQQHVEQQATTASVNESSLYIKAVPSKRRIYEQEPILLSYKGYAKAGVALSSITPVQLPDLKGFWTQEINKSQYLEYTPERIEGDLFRVIDIRQYVIFPQKSGTLTIPANDFTCSVVKQREFADDFDAFLNGGGNYSVRVDRTSPAVDIEVIPLPTPKPAGFSGGVGHLSIKAELLTDMPKTNDVATLRVTISGKGNMKLIKAPAITFPKDFDTYDAKITDKSEVTADGIMGDVYFDYTFVPRNIGEYDIPSFDFVYFDSEKGEYVTLKSDPVRLDVKKGDRSREDVEAEMRMRNSDIADIHTGESAPFTTTGLRGILWVGSWRFFAALGGLVALFVAGILVAFRIIRRNADVVSSRNRRARKKANKHLRNAEKVLTTGDQHEFYGALTTALRGYFADKLACEAAALTTDSIVGQLAERNMADEALLTELRRLLEDCDFARFAPSADASQRSADLERASTLLETLDAAFKGTRRHDSSTMNRLSTILLALVFIIASATTQTAAASLQAAATSSLTAAASSQEKADSVQTVAAASPQKAAADAAYANRRYVEADSLYRAIDPKVQMADVQYNLGNTAYRQKHYAQAALAYQRALHLDPGHDDARKNLGILHAHLLDRFDATSSSAIVTWLTDNVHAHSVFWWGAWTFGLLCLVFAGLIVYFFTRRTWVRKCGFFFALFSLLLMIGTASCGYVQRDRFLHNDDAVILTPEAQFFTAPSTKANVQATLHEGTTVTVLETSGDKWARVALPDGREGWLPSQSIERVVPKL